MYIMKKYEKTSGDLESGNQSGDMCLERVATAGLPSSKCKDNDNELGVWSDFAFEGLKDYE